MMVNRRLFFFLIAGIGTLFALSSCTLALGIGSTRTRPSDGMAMVYVPAGKFTMGMEAEQALDICHQFYSGCCCNKDWFFDEEPVHLVHSDAFWIDQTEVTNRMYALCVADGRCQPPEDVSSWTRSSYYGNPQFDNYPVIFVDWNDAARYCLWAGARLPTEAEWEKAARGTNNQIFPWGNEDPTCSLANFSSDGQYPCVGDTSPVGYHLPGASPYGALDMAGNVDEWVNDWYSESYYGTSSEYGRSVSDNPQGPASDMARVYRGGSWLEYEVNLRVAFRDRAVPYGESNVIGFRCASSTKP